MKSIFILIFTKVPVPQLFLTVAVVVIVRGSRQEEVAVDLEEQVDKDMEKDLEQQHVLLYMTTLMIPTQEIPRCHSPQDVLLE